MTVVHDFSFLTSGLEDFDALARNLTFKRVWRTGDLKESDRWLACLSALASKGYLVEFVHHAKHAVDAGMDPIKASEVAIHVSMYAGIPGSVSLIRALEEEGLQTNLSGERPPPQKTEANRMSIGEDVKSVLHTGRSRMGYASDASSASELYNIATEFLYGDLWIRDGLSIRERMVCSIASFTALSLVSQQRKFFQSAANVGISKQEVVATIGATAPYSGFAPALAAIAVADEVIINSKKSS